MEENTAPDVSQDTQEGAPETPPADTVQDTPTQEAVDFEKRYNDLRPELDRSRQELSEYEQVVAAAQSDDPETRAWGLQALGLQPEEEAWTPEEGETQEDYDARIARLENTLAQAAQQQQEQAQIESEDGFISEQIDGLAKEKGQTFSEEEVQLLGDMSTLMRDERGAPDVNAAYERIYGNFLKSQRENWTSSKRKATLPPEGIPGSEKVNLKDPQERQKAAARVMEAESGDD